MKKAKEKQAKNDAIKAKRQQTNLKNHAENSEIKTCKFRIKKLLKAKSAYESLSSLSSAMSFFNGNTSELKPKPKSEKVIEIEKQITVYEERIIELNKIKKAKNKKGS